MSAPTLRSTRLNQGPALTLAIVFTLLSPGLIAAEELAPKRDVEEVLVTGDGSQVLLLEAYPGEQVARGGRAGILGNMDMMDAPFTSTNYTNALIRNQQSRSVADVLQNDPVVRVSTGFGNFQELYIIRGFPVYSDDMTYNGLYGILPRQYVAAELLERVEVFRGANSFLNGASPGGSGVGGLVNLVPKRAGEEPETLLSGGFEKGGQIYTALDMSRRFGETEENGLRLNIVRRDGDNAVSNQDRQLSVFSLGLDHQGERLRLSADIGYQDNRIDNPRPSVTPTGEIPKPPEADSNYAQPWTYTDEKQLFGVVRAEYQLTDSTSLWAAFGGREGEEDNMLANPNTDSDGNTTASRFDNIREDKIYSSEVGLRSDFETGSIGHRLIASASYYSLESKNAFAFYLDSFASNLYQPVNRPAPNSNIFPGGDLKHPLITEETDTSSLAIADMLSFMQGRVLLTLGARYQKIDKGGFDYNSGAPDPASNYSESALTPVTGLVYKMRESIALYANYSEALQPGATAPATSNGNPVSNAGESLDPFRSEQFEIGAKYDGGNIGGSISLFSTNKPSSLVEASVFTDNGEQRNRGIELSVFGQANQNLKLLGGLSWIESEQLNTTGGADEGNEAIGVPNLQANINAEWTLPSMPGLALDARAIYTGEQYANSANTVKLQAWTRLDAGLRYTTTLGGNEVSFRGRVENLTDRHYWASVGGFPGSNYLVLGSPRSLVLSATIKL